MSIAEMEQRLTALEEAFVQLRAELTQQPNGPAAPPAPTEEELLPDVEYPVVLNVPPKEEYQFRARIVSIEPGPQTLGLSDADWAFLASETPDE